MNYGASQPNALLKIKNNSLISPESPEMIHSTKLFQQTMDAVISGTIEEIPLGQGRVKEAAQRIRRSLEEVS